MNLRDYKLYILDYDGSLLDSMPMWKNSASSFVKYLGHYPKEDLDDRIPVFTDRECGMVLKEEYHLEWDIDTIMKMIDEYVDIEYAKVKLKDGALDFLKKLKALDKKVVLLSASGDHILNISLNSLGIKDYFDEVISTYNHETLSKVTGTAIVHLLEKYNLQNNEALIIDDALSTILSAKRLGVDSIAIYDDVTSNHHEDELEENALLYLKMSELNDLF